MTSKERILQFVEFKGVSNRNFCQKISVSHTYFSKKGAMTSDVLEKIYNTYPEINLDWVITGRGNMFYKNNDSNMNNGKIEFGKLIKNIMNYFDISFEKMLNDVLCNAYSKEKFEDILTWEDKMDIGVFLYIDHYLNTDFAKWIFGAGPNNSLTIDQQKRFIDAFNFLYENGVKDIPLNKKLNSIEILVIIEDLVAKYKKS